MLASDWIQSNSSIHSYSGFQCNEALMWLWLPEEGSIVITISCGEVDISCSRVESLIFRKCLRSRLTLEFIPDSSISCASTVLAILHPHWPDHSVRPHIMDVCLSKDLSKIILHSNILSTRTLSVRCTSKRCTHNLSWDCIYWHTYCTRISRVHTPARSRRCPHDSVLRTTSQETLVVFVFFSTSYQKNCFIQQFI